MANRLDWIAALNDETTWQNDSDIKEWLSGLAGRAIVLDSACLAQLKESFAFMRRQVQALHFDGSVDLKWLDEKLKHITIGIVHDDNPSALPRFRARARSGKDADFVRSIVDTLLLQFAQFLAAAAAGDSEAAVSRCEGLYKDPKATGISTLPAVPAHEELKWRRELEALTESGLESAAEIQRCGDFFLSGPKARFCSDKCRFTTFQIVKQIKDPSYLAEKQRRYRHRKER